jgi:hypothetical protein
MTTRASIYQRIERVLDQVITAGSLALALWTLIQIGCLMLGDLAVHLAVLNGAWQRDIAEHCVQQVPKCQSVSFRQQYLTTQHGGHSWQWVGSRLDITVVCSVGAPDSIRHALVDYMGDWSAARVHLHFVDSKGQTW